MEFSGNSLVNDANLVAYYKMENANASVGTFNLTNTGGAPFNPAKFNNGVDFGSVNNAVYLGTANNLGMTGTTPITVTGWYKNQATVGTHPLFVHYSNTTADRYFICYYVNNGVDIKLAIDNSGFVELDYNIDLGTSDFWNLGFVRNGANGAKIYVNGALGTTNAAQGTVTGGANLTNIGFMPAIARYASFLIDDMTIFNRVLTDAEMASIYGQGHILSTNKYW